MKFRAVMKKSEGWWIGWLIDLPGVNAQEKTKKELLQSLRIGAEDIPSMEVPFEAEAQMTTVMVKDPVWAKNQTA